MSLFRTMRSEAAGAWRSVRYDLGRRPVEPPADGPDVTSTGMNTFGGTAVEFTARPAGRSPRRVAAVTVFGMLTVLGSAGAYLGVVHGLGSLLHETPAAADTFPAPPAATTTYTPNAGLGAGPAPTLTRRAAAATLPVANTTVPATRSSTPNASPIRTLNPTNPECGSCHFPPVPTPTAPSSVPSPTASSASPEPSDSTSVEPSPSETSATPSESAEPSHNPQDRHRRRHH
ncbi:hypothetical protein [Paractinoplanes rishiriensis]|uniref:hypothetical protein n=1 Tax=Paractinoplanes rishiriensis TaxID=1050105 RepID=UPI0019413980|nr:hypothetical protein [Actinoplanes rishiriensis]